MPKVSIREIDNTGGETREFLNYTVLIPGPKLGKLKADSQTACEPFEPNEALVSKKELKDLVAIDENNNKVAAIHLDQELGFLMMNELLALGLSVFYVPAYIIATDNKIASLIDDFNFETFQDRGFDLRFITIGGLKNSSAEEADFSFSKDALECAALRGDSVALIDIPDKGENSVVCYKHNVNDEFITIDEYNMKRPSAQTAYNECFGFLVYTKPLEHAETEYISQAEYNEKTAEQKLQYTRNILSLGQYNTLSTEAKAQCTTLFEGIAVPLTTADEMDTWVQENLQEFAKKKIERAGVSWTDQNETYGRYGAIFAPTVTATFADSEGTAFTKEIPASFDYLACFGKYIKKFKSWFAMSGSTRGVSPFSKVNPIEKFGDADIDVFQVRSGDENNGHVATNIICNIRPYGNIVWGNRTMHPLSKPENGDANAAIQLTASSFLNVRQLCIDIKKTLYRAAKRFTFEPNSDELWFNFKGAITPLLDEMKANQGINGYQVIRVRTNKKALFVARIKIVPVEAVEDFDLTVELADSIEVTEE